MVSYIGQLIDKVYNMNTPAAEKKISANIILSSLESQGMQPPTIILLPDHYNRAEGTYGFESNEWEEE